MKKSLVTWDSRIFLSSAKQHIAAYFAQLIAFRTRHLRGDVLMLLLLTRVYKKLQYKSNVYNSFIECYLSH